MKKATATRLRWLPVGFFVLVAAYALSGCSDKELTPQLPQVKLGNNLSLAVKDVQEKSAIFYQERDENGETVYYSLEASGSDRKLVLVRVQVHNRAARTIKLQVGPDGYRLMDQAGKYYESLNPFGETRRLSPTLPSEESLYQFIWGPFDLLKEFSIEAWTVFDIPKEVRPWQFRWNPVDVVFVPFYDRGTDRPESTPTPTPDPSATVPPTPTPHPTRQSVIGR